MKNIQTTRVYIVFYEDDDNEIQIDRAYLSYAKANKRVAELSKMLGRENDIFIAKRIAL